MPKYFISYEYRRIDKRMVFANINARLSVLEEKLNSVAPQVSNESFDNKLAELEARLATVEASVANVANVEQALSVLANQVAEVKGRLNEISEIMQNA